MSKYPPKRYRGHHEFVRAPQHYVESIDDTEVEYHPWHKPLRIALKNKRTGEVIVEWKDQDASGALREGFLNDRSPEDLRRSAFDYAMDRGILKTKIRSTR